MYLENRATGRGGYKLSQIAQALDVSVQWLLGGPDTVDMAHVPGFDQSRPVAVLEVREDLPATWAQAGWPFQRVSPSQWARLTRRGARYAGTANSGTAQRERALPPMRLG